MASGEIPNSSNLTIAERASLFSPVSSWFDICSIRFIASYEEDSDDGIGSNFLLYRTSILDGVRLEKVLNEVVV